MLTVPVQRSELIETIRNNIDWSQFKTHQEIQEMHEFIVRAASLMILAAPQHLMPVKVHVK